MPERVHVVLDAAERERFRRQAQREGKSLSLWLREAAREKLRLNQAADRLQTAAELEAFFRACDEREAGLEPDWSDHLRVMEKSVSSGAGEP